MDLSVLKDPTLYRFLIAIDARWDKEQPVAPHTSWPQRMNTELML
jgi:hypothetical protein